MDIDQNHILCKSEPTEQNRSYTQIVDDYTIKDYDKTLVVYHKKQIKGIPLKDLGNNMSVFYLWERSHTPENLDPQSFLSVLNIFGGFDEETGQQYAFLPKFSPFNTDNINSQLEKLWITLQLKNTDKGVLVENFEKTGSSDPISTLFGLCFFYGKFDIKNGDLKSAKAHIPLFGQYLSKKEEFDTQIHTLQQQGIFVKTRTQENNEGLSYEFIISDYQILQAFANFLKPIEKVDKISKYEYMLEAKAKLLEYDPKIAKLLKNKTLKLLTK